MAVGALAQEKSEEYFKPERHHILFGYGINPLGTGSHLLYGFEWKKNRVYGGLRFQENSPYNFADPENTEVFRHDEGGIAPGLMAGYQRNFEFRYSSITPFASSEIEYAYLNSRMEGLSWNSQTSQFDPTIWKIPARSLLIPSLNIGFEAQLHKYFYLRQSLGAAPLLDYLDAAHLRFLHLPKFNGIGINAKVSLVIRF